MKSDMNGGEMGVITSLGMSFPIKAVKLFMEVRWTGGMTNISNSAPDPTDSHDMRDLRTSTGSILFGFGF